MNLRRWWDTDKDVICWAKEKRDVTHTRTQAHMHCNVTFWMHTIGLNDAVSYLSRCALHVCIWEKWKWAMNERWKIIMKHSAIDDNIYYIQCVVYRNAVWYRVYLACHRMHSYTLRYIRLYLVCEVRQALRMKLYRLCAKGWESDNRRQNKTKQNKKQQKEKMHKVKRAAQVVFWYARHITA